MTSLNRRCKLVVEIDRSQRAVEAGNYTTQLLTLRGLDGYAKSDLLVGLPPAVVQNFAAMVFEKSIRLRWFFVHRQNRRTKKRALTRKQKTSGEKS